jgi:hypothetical protein
MQSPNKPQGTTPRAVEVPMRQMKVHELTGGIPLIA